MSTSNSVIEGFLAELKANWRSSPDDWNKFYLLLKAKQQLGQKKPPTPFILAASGESSASKHGRLTEQLHWAKESGCIDDAFFYLKNLSAEQWSSCSAELWRKESYPGQGWHWGWTSDKKPKVSAKDLEKFINILCAHWNEIGEKWLCDATLPFRFKGTKSRRLIVLVRNDVLPPWGTWSFLAAGEGRRAFTHFRAAINAIIRPHEVDHIDFVHKYAKPIP